MSQCLAVGSASIPGSENGHAVPCPTTHVKTKSKPYSNTSKHNLMTNNRAYSARDITLSSFYLGLSNTNPNKLLYESPHPSLLPLEKVSMRTYWDWYKLLRPIPLKIKHKDINRFISITGNQIVSHGKIRHMMSVGTHRGQKTVIISPNAS
jgi:hypothetical protein